MDKVLAFHNKLSSGEQWENKENLDVSFSTNIPHHKWFPSWWNTKNIKKSFPSANIHIKVWFAKSHLCLWHPSLLSPCWDDNNNDDDNSNSNNVSISEECSLKIKHNDFPLHTFWTFNMHEYPTIASKALTVLMQFATSANLYSSLKTHDVQRKGKTCQHRRWNKESTYNTY